MCAVVIYVHVLFGVPSPACTHFRNQCKSHQCWINQNCVCIRNMFARFMYVFDCKLILWLGEFVVREKSWTRADGEQSNKFNYRSFLRCWGERECEVWRENCSIGSDGKTCPRYNARNYWHNFRVQQHFVRGFCVYYGMIEILYLLWTGQRCTNANFD